MDLHYYKINVTTMGVAIPRNGTTRMRNLGCWAIITERQIPATTDPQVGVRVGSAWVLGGPWGAPALEPGLVEGDPGAGGQHAGVPAVQRRRLGEKLQSQGVGRSGQYVDNVKGGATDGLEGWGGGGRFFLRPIHVSSLE